MEQPGSRKATPWSHAENMFAQEYNKWMHAAYRCPSEAHFEHLGELTAAFAEEANCHKAAKQFRLKFSKQRFAFFAAEVCACGM